MRNRVPTGKRATMLPSPPSRYVRQSHAQAHSPRCAWYGGDVVTRGSRTPMAESFRLAVYITTSRSKLLLEPVAANTMTDCLVRQAFREPAFRERVARRATRTGS
jgi:hypothetical protein